MNNEELAKKKVAELVKELNEIGYGLKVVQEIRLIKLPEGEKQTVKGMEEVSSDSPKPTQQNPEEEASDDATPSDKQDATVEEAGEEKKDEQW